MRALRGLSVFLFTIAVVPGFGLPLPIPSGLLGTRYVTFDGNSFTWPNMIGAFPAGYGGAFQASIYPNAADTTGSPIRATVWCVDYQLDVEPGSQYTANITALSAITTPTDANVRYGNLTSSGPPPSQWANPVTGPANQINTAAYRYSLAAWLVSQYDNSSNVIQPENPENDDRNKAIQTAIWYVTYNSDYSPGATWAPFDPASYGAGDYANWVALAEQNVSTGPTAVTLANWAVISGPASATGVLGAPQNVNGQPSYQTFLAEVDIQQPGNDTPLPEPTFYGLLSLGLGGLFAVARGRRQKPVLPVAPDNKNHAV